MANGKPNTPRNDKSNKSRARGKKPLLDKKHIGYLIGAVLVALPFASPPIIGMYATGQLEDQYEKFAAHAGLTVKKVDEGGGWRSGYVTHKFTVTDPAVAEVFPYEFELTASMRYGPFKSSQTDKWTLFDADIEPYYRDRRVFKSVKPIARLNKDMDGEGLFVVDIPKQEFYLPNLTTVEVQSAIMLIDLSDSNPYTNIRYDVEDLSIKHPDFEMSIGLWQSTTTLKPTLTGMYLGDEVSKIKNVRLNIPQTGQRITIREIDGLSQSGVVRQMIEGSSNIKINKILTNEESYGPIELSVELGGWPERDLIEFRDQVINNQEKYASSPAVLDKKMQQTMQYYGGKLLENDPHVEISLDKLVLPEGEFSTSFYIGFEGIEQEDLKKPEDVLTKMTSKVQLAADRKLLEHWLSLGLDLSGLAMLSMMAPPEAQQALDFAPPSVPGLDPESIKTTISSAIQQRWAVEEGDKLKTTLEFDKGKTILNGEEVIMPFSPMALGSGFSQ